MERSERRFVEPLEDRRLLAFDLVAAYAQNETPFYVMGQSAQTLTEAPQQITLRFSAGIKIAAGTLGSIAIVRSGAAGDGFGDAGTKADEPIVPGSITVNDLPNENEVVIRFAETLPDDTYRITIGAGLRTAANDSATPRSFDFRLNLGAFVRSVVPQPVTRAGAALTQDRNAIAVSFNSNDPLDVTSAQTVSSYRLFEVNPTTGADVAPAAPVNPTGVAYDGTTGRAVLTFANGAIADGKLYRLQIGGDAGVAVVPAPVAEGSDNNSSFTTARDLGALAAAGVTVNGVISPRTTLVTPAGNLGFPTPDGAIDAPGHRDIPVDSGSHGNATGLVPEAAANVQYYNFQDDYGQFNGVMQKNAITETQKQRAREVFELFSRYTGIRFVESPDQGMTVATGDIRVAAPTFPPQSVAGVGGPGRTIMNSSMNWGQSEYGGSWFLVAVHEIGHALGLMHTYDLPAIMGKALPGEGIYPADYDIEHLLQIEPTNGSDVDVYKFSLPDAGKVSAETVVARPGQQLYSSSKLDSLLTLYRQDPITGRREIVARNDDSFGRDSFIGLDLAAGTYFLAVSSTGNDAFNPEASDSGYGGRSDGAYQLKLGFLPASLAANTLVDTTGTPLDGDRDGKPGGVFNFWFNTASTADTIFVDKASASRAASITSGQVAVTGIDVTNLAVGMRVKGAGIRENTTIAAIGTGTITLSLTASATNATAALTFSNGSVSFPFVEIDDALTAVTASTKIIRIVGNDQNKPYLVGTTLAGQPLPDGATFNVPKGVTAMIDAGAIFKFRAANIDVGSSSALVDRSGAAIQVLGLPGSAVIFTSYHDDSIGGNSDGVGPAVSGGQWGGIVLRRDSDSVSKKAFVNSISGATIEYGGGQVLVDSQLDSFAPIQLETTRPTLVFNTIRKSAGPAISANPDSFEESDGRVGPELRGNRLLENSINGLFIKVRTALGSHPDKLDVPARLKSSDIVYVLQDNLLIDGGVGGYLRTGGVDTARKSGRLTIDAGVIVKLQGARIELERGTAQLIAEGTAGQAVIFTSLGDNRFGAGGTFDTNGNLPDVRQAGDWGGIVVNAGGKASIDHAYLGYGGGQTPIEGSFASFNVIEVHQGDLRLAHSRIENNAAGSAAGSRNGRGGNAAATVFVRGAQPVILGNDFRDNLGVLVSMNANALTDAMLPDPGRSSGPIDRDARFDDNRGPLVRDNRISYTIDAAAGRPAGGATGGMEVRGEEITVESVWDDVDIVHVLRSEIIVQNLHTHTGVRLMSQVNASLVVKLLGANAGFTAAGYGLDIDDRIGGTVQVVGQPGYPVVLTSLADDTVAASVDSLGRTVKDTNNDGSASAPTPGDWRSLQFLPMSNDRNVSIVREAEKGATQGIDVNSDVGSAQPLGILAPNFATGSNTYDSAQEKSGDDVRRLGFEVHGTIATDDATDVDVYAFTGYAGSEVWIDIDKTSPSLDTMVELLDAAGNVRARSVDSQLEGGIQQETLFGAATANPLVYTFQLSRPEIRRESILGSSSDQMLSIDALGAVVLSNLSGSDFPARLATTGTYNPATRVLTLTYDRPVVAAPQISFAYAYATTAIGAGTKGLAQPLARDAANGGDHYSINPKDAGMRVVLPRDGQPIGTPIQYFIRVRSQPRYEPVTTGVANGSVTALNNAAYETDLADPSKVKNGATSGAYELRVRQRQLDEKPGSTVRFADIRYPTIGLDVQGLPRNSPLVGETGENAGGSNDSFASAQYVGNLLQTDRNTISIAGDISSASDVDWYTFALNYEQIQSIGGVSGGQKTWATVFDLDYGAGVRGDLTISVYDSQGRLLYTGRDSNVASDQPGVGQGADTDNLAAGSLDPHDPFIGSVQMPAGNPTGSSDVESGTAEPPDPSKQLRFYVAVSSGGLLPSVLNAAFDGGTANSLVRLEPINSVTRVVEDHIGFLGYTSGPAAANGGVAVMPSQETPLFDLLQLATHVTPFTLSDVTLFVSTDSSLVTVDAMRGGVETTISAGFGGTTIGDLFMRPDGNLYLYGGLSNNVSTAGQLGLVDSGTGAVTVIGNDNIKNPVTTTQANVAAAQTDTVSTTTFNLANRFLVQPQVAPITGTIRYQWVDTSVTPNVTNIANWNFTTGSAPINGVANIAIGSTIPGPGGYAGPSPVSGTVNLVTGVVSVSWGSVLVNATGTRLTTITYQHSFQDIASDAVDAMAWKRTATGDYADLVYSVWNPLASGSFLYRADPLTGSAAVVTGQNWGIQGELTTDGVRTTGMAWLGDTLYGVDLAGNLFTVSGLETNDFAISTTLVRNITVGGAPIAFEGLTVGPQNLQGGFFSDKLFGIDGAGNLYCFDTNGNLQTVFDADGDGVADANSIQAGAAGATGLAFSPLDINLWHDTGRRGSNAGHGVNPTLDVGDNSRDGAAERDGVAESAGGQSMYFGFEGGQHGVVSPDWAAALSSNPAIANTYNLPGGAYGSLTTNSFSLVGSTAADKPTLYFNYFLQSDPTASAAGDETSMQDSARVFISKNNGVTWQLLATNNPVKSTADTADGELPATLSVSSDATRLVNQHVQQLYRDGTWRQARVDLSEWANESNLRLRIDFSTAGGFDATQMNANGDLINQIDGVAGTTGSFGSAERGQKNNYEGFYVDDFIVGFAERGEMVTGAPAAQTGFVTLPSAPVSNNVPSPNFQGQYQLEIRRGSEYGVLPSKLKSDVQVSGTFDTNAVLTRANRLLGDANHLREQGQFVIDGNLISNAKTYGISIDAGRDGATNAPSLGVVLNTAAPNSARLVPGVVVTNNVVAASGTAGIRFSGDTNTGIVPIAAVPFGRIVNNTIVGTKDATGTGIVVNENAGPTLLNNLFANLALGVSVDTSSQASTVVGTSAYWNTTTKVSGLAESQSLTLDANPFVNAAAGNYYLRAGSAAIDSGINSLADRPASVSVKETLGIPDSPIIAPDRDLYGQLRSDDPSQANAPGLGSNVFKDRGAIDRADFVQPFAALAVPLDNAAADQDAAADGVRLLKADARSVTTIELQLDDYGVGIDTTTVVSGAFDVRRDGTLLVAGTDYSFNYLDATNRVVFAPASVFPFGTYRIAVKQATVNGVATNMVADLAGNPILPNQGDGTTSFLVVLQDLPGAPAGLAVDGTLGDGQMKLTWAVPPVTGGAAIIDYVVEYKLASSPTWTLLNDGVSATSGATITGLTNGQVYQFRVAAKNEVFPAEIGDYATLSAVPLSAPTMVLGAGVTPPVSLVEAIQANGIVSVTGAAPFTISVTFTNGDKTLTKTVGGTGFSQNIVLVKSEAETLGSGTVTVTAARADGFGNLSAAATLSFALDALVPDAPTLALGPNVADGASAAEAIQATGVVTVSGEAGAAIAVTFTHGSNSVIKNLVGTGAAQPVELTVEDRSALGDGLIAVSAVQSDAAGNPQSALPGNASFTLDTVAPTITAFSSTTTSGTYKIGDTINITATTSEDVQSGATITVTLNTDATVTLTHATATTLTGTYTVAAGHTAADLTVTSYSAGTVRDLAGNLLTSTTVPNGANNIAGAKDIVVDGIAPTIAAFSSTSANGDYKVGDAINITATTSEAVKAGATITVTLDTGATVTLTRATATTLTGTYTVAAGHSSADLTVASFTAGSVFDLANNPLTSTTVPGGANNIAGSKAIVIDGVAPTITAFLTTTPNGSYKAGDSINITATTSEDVQAGATISVTLNTGATLTLTRATATTLTGSYTVAAGHNNPDLTVTAFTAGAVSDLAGNPLTSTTVPSGTNNIGGSSAIVVDTVAPTIAAFSSSSANGVYKVGDTIIITATTSEAVQVGATITVTLNTGATVELTRATATTLTGAHTVVAGQSISDLAVASFTAGSVVDLANNSLTSTTVPSGMNNIAGPKDIGVDGIAPTITSFSSTTANGVYRTGGLINITATTSEAVRPGATINVTLDTGAAVTLTRATATTMTGSYIVAADENSADLTVASFDAGTVLDLAGNPLTSETVPTGINNVAGSKAIVVDTDAPTITITSDKDSLKIGETATITFDLSEPSANFVAGDVTVAGGTLSRFAGSGASYSATFTPTANSIADGDLSVAAARFTDAAGNNNAIGSLGALISIDTVAPGITITSDKTNLKIGETAVITFTLSEPSDTFTASDVATTGGTLSGFAPSDNSGTVYTANFTPAANSAVNGAISVAAGRFADGAGNSNIAGSLATSLKLDTIAPRVTITSSQPALRIGEKATIAFSINEASTTFTDDDVAVTGGTLSGFTGSGTRYSAIFTPAVNSIANGTISVAASRFTDAAGNDNTASSLTPSILVDTIAPTVTITSNKDRLKIGETASITFALSENSVNFVAADVTVTGGTLSAFAGSGKNYTATLTPTANSSADAIVSVAAARFNDAAGNNNTAGSVAISVDTAAPTVTIVSNKGSLRIGETATISFTLSEPSVSFTGDDVSVAGGTLSVFTGTGANYSAIFTPTANATASGTISVAANRFADAAGNNNLLGTLATAIKIDTLAPTVTITSSRSSLRAGDRATVTFTLSEASASFGAADVTVAGGTLSSFTGRGTSYSATLIPTANANASGMISVDAARFTDAAGNDNLAGSLGTAIKIDTIAPTVTITSDKNSLRSGETTTIAFELSEASTNFAAADVTVAGGTLSGFAGSNRNYTAVFTPTANSIASGTISVAASRFTDAIGNNNVAGSLPRALSIDTVVPTVTSITSTLANGTYAIGREVPIQVPFREAVFVTGTPSLALNTSPQRSATYVSGSGSSVLTFLYTVLAGDASADLNYASTAALTGGTIVDAAGNVANRTLPALLATGSLGVNKNIVINGAIRAIAGGFSTAASGPGYVTAVSTVPVTFNTSVSGVTETSFRLYRDGQLVSLAGATVTGSGTDWTLSLPSTATNPRGKYRLDVGGPTSGIVSGSVAMSTVTSLYWQRL
jgi:hypothetical protein